MKNFFTKSVPSRTGVKWLLNVGLMLGFVPLILLGWLQEMYANDPTYITVGMTAIFMYGIMMILIDRWDIVGWLAEAMVFMGLIGTVLGFIIAFKIDPTRVSDISYIQIMVGSMVAGISVALHTTFIGAVAFIWYRFNQFCFEPEDA